MKKGITLQGAIPLRKDPSQISEIVSQVLFGEEFRILDSMGTWHLISLDYDGFEGWVSQECIRQVKTPNEAHNKSITGSRMVAAPLCILQNLKLAQQLLLPAGSILPKTDGNHLSHHGFDYEVRTDKGLITPGPAIDPGEFGKGLVSLPYLSGGRSGFGFDGPGLVQMLCRMMGITIPRQCSEQAGSGTTINFINEAKKGDLAFFENEAGEIFHVGMVLDGGDILHSSQSVRIDKLDQQGIFSIEKEDYTHKLRIIKRLIGKS